ncbi:MAG: hypothetical protein DWQ48_07990 [Bacteroidetes bacterium]|nr:MAG: hypothetical protein DWQ48_07990 [Bacteroidota bacterium]
MIQMVFSIPKIWGKIGKIQHPLLNGRPQIEVKKPIALLQTEFLNLAFAFYLNQMNSLLLIHHYTIFFVDFFLD